MDHILFHVVIICPSLTYIRFVLRQPFQFLYHEFVESTQSLVLPTVPQFIASSNS